MLKKVIYSLTHSKKKKNNKKKKLNALIFLECIFSFSVRNSSIVDFMKKQKDKKKKKKLYLRNYSINVHKTVNLLYSIDVIHIYFIL